MLLKRFNRENPEAGRVQALSIKAERPKFYMVVVDVCKTTVYGCSIRKETLYRSMIELLELHCKDGSLIDYFFVQAQSRKQAADLFEIE